MEAGAACLVDESNSSPRCRVGLHHRDLPGVLLYDLSNDTRVLVIPEPVPGAAPRFAPSTAKRSPSPAEAREESNAHLRIPFVTFCAFVTWWERCRVARMRKRRTA